MKLKSKFLANGMAGLSVALLGALTLAAPVPVEDATHESREALAAASASPSFDEQPPLIKEEKSDWNDNIPVGESNEGKNSSGLSTDPAVELIQQLNQLRQQLQTLQGQVEQLSHTSQQLQNQQKTFYSDLDHRLVRLEKLSGTKTPSTLPTPQSNKPLSNSPAKSLKH